MEKRKKELTICCNPECNITFLKDKSEINRNEKIGRKNYCSLTCSGKINNKHLLKYVEGNVKFLLGMSNNRKDDYTGLREHYRRLKKRKHEIGVTLDDILEQWNKQNGICVYSRIQLLHPNHNGDRTNLNTASLDRIDSDKGYVKGNIQFISITCNHAKNNLTHNQMLEFCKIMANN